METTIVAGPVKVMDEAQTFLGEMAGTPAERKKKSLPAATGVQPFLLFVRGGSVVPDHHVKGPITVQTLLGHAQMKVQDNSFDLPAGNMISIAADVVHDVRGIDDSVLLVTHALPQEQK